MLGKILELARGLLASWRTDREQRARGDGYDWAAGELLRGASPSEIEASLDIGGLIDGPEAAFDDGASYALRDWEDHSHGERHLRLALDSLAAVLDVNPDPAETFRAVVRLKRENSDLRDRLRDMQLAIGAPRSGGPGLIAYEVGLRELSHLRARVDERGPTFGLPTKSISIELVGDDSPKRLRRLAELVGFGAMCERYRLERDEPVGMKYAGDRYDYASDAEKDWEFWRPLVTDAMTDDLDLEQLKQELSDYSRLLHMVPIVLDHATGGMVSHPFTDTSVVLSLIDDRVSSLTASEADEDEKPASSGGQS